MAPQYSTQAVVAVTAVGAVTALGYYLYKKKRGDQMPTNWEPIGKVSDMYMYPLKSGRRLEVQTAICTEYGLQSIDPSIPHFRDRCLVVYKESTGEVITARTRPKIVLIETFPVDNRKFGLSAPNMDNLIFKFPTLKDKDKDNHIRMFDKEDVVTIDCGDEAAQWISKYLLDQPTGLRIGFHDGNYRRDIEKVHKKYIKAYPLLDNSVGGMYSDLATILIMTKASMEDLEKRIPNSDVTVHNFRPNVLIDSEKIQPYDEENWDWFKIGDIVFRNVMLCPRCSFPTINPETAEFSKNYEPITTMKKYRPLIQFQSESPSPNMGIYARVSNPGQIRTGDTIYIGKN